MRVSARGSRPIAVDLFSGAGGLSLGFEQAGFDIAAAVEMDPVHAATHVFNFPNSPVICRDVRELTGDAIRSESGIGRHSIEVVVGGPPCQGFSFIGHRDVGDPRNSLLFQYVRLVIELKPRAFVMENVPGIATGPHAALLERALAALEDSGFRIVRPLRALNAAEHGVPQHRTRLFVLGARRGTRLAEYPAKTSTRRLNGRERMLSMEFTPPLCPSVSDAIGDLPNIDDYQDLFGTDELRARPSDGSTYARKLRGELRDPGDYSHPRRSQPGVITGCMRAKHSPLSRRRFAATEPGATEPISRFFRLPPDGVSNTLRAGTASDRGAFTAPRPIHPVHARCISVREAARLHSFPDWFRFHRTIWHGFRQIGNSVPPILGRAVGAEVLKALGVMPERPPARLATGDQELSALTMRDAAARFGVSPHVVAPRLRRASAVRS